MHPLSTAFGGLITTASAAQQPTCQPTNDFLYHFSRIFGVCVPTPLAFISNTLGTLSILSWLFAQLPQVYRNWQLSSVSGLSFLFLLEWGLGDLGNLFGSLFTHQAPWQVCIGAYYVLIDIVLLGQYVWYEKLRHADDTGVSQIDGLFPGQYDNRRGAEMFTTRPRTILRAATAVDYSDQEKKSSYLRANSYMVRRPSAASAFFSPRAVLLVACLLSIANASPLPASTLQTPNPTANYITKEQLGTILSWCSTVMYLGSRFPQIYKNWQRQSTAGLSAQLFAAAFCGNLFYASALATNPNAWYDFEANGGHGWAGPDGNNREAFIAAAMPFFIGAAGVLALDATVGLQFMMYGEGVPKVVVLEGVISDDTRSALSQGSSFSRHPGRWQRVSGWMRGGSGTEASSIKEESEGQPLLGTPSQGSAAYTAEQGLGVAVVDGVKGTQYGSL